MTREEFISLMGYRDDSPFRNEEYIDINTPDGIIDMSKTGIPLEANGRVLLPYSGQHQFPPGVVRERPIDEVQLKAFQGDNGSNETTGFTIKRGPNDVLSKWDISGYDTDLLMEAIQRHEHRGSFGDVVNENKDWVVDWDNYEMDNNYNPWTRTSATGSGSSAYGPGQLTQSIANILTTPGERRFYDVENTDSTFHQTFLDQADNFIKWGGSDMPKSGKDENGNDVSMYDYGGVGSLTTEQQSDYNDMWRIIVEGKLRQAVSNNATDPVLEALKSYGTGSDWYAKVVKKHYDALKKKKDEAAVETPELKQGGEQVSESSRRKHDRTKLILRKFRAGSELTHSEMDHMKNMGLVKPKENTDNDKNLDPVMFEGVTKSLDEINIKKDIVNKTNGNNDGIPLSQQIDLYMKYVEGGDEVGGLVDKAGAVYDKLNRVYYNDAKSSGMMVVDYMKSLQD